MKLAEIPTDPESLNQLSKSELVQLIIDQQKKIEQLKQEIAKLKISRDLDSQTSSKPPSTDLLKKSEQESFETEEQQDSKRKPGGQPGHIGTTRKGFSRVALPKADLFEIAAKFSVQKNVRVVKTICLKTNQLR